MISSRSTWACELKYSCYLRNSYRFCHAPRERVSWNLLIRSQDNVILVTLHVSVWVEICWNLSSKYRKSSRSTWACELKCSHVRSNHSTLWSRSTWACELKFHSDFTTNEEIRSRSTWACELKCKGTGGVCRRNSHAPRERVSWNSL